MGPYDRCCNRLRQLRLQLCKAIQTCRLCVWSRKFQAACTHSMHLMHPLTWSLQRLLCKYDHALMPTIKGMAMNQSRMSVGVQHHAHVTHVHL